MGGLNVPRQTEGHLQLVAGATTTVDEKCQQLPFNIVYPGSAISTLISKPNQNPTGDEVVSVDVIVVFNPPFNPPVVPRPQDTRYVVFQN